MPHPVFAIKKNAQGQFFFQMTAKSGQVLMTSEPFMSRYGCEQAIAFVQQSAGEAQMVDCTDASSRDHDPSVLIWEEQQADTWVV